jgi:hypothetical protein
MTHPKPFGELSRAEKGELLLAHHEGKRVEYFSALFHGWTTVAHVGPAWCDNKRYRIAPEPLIPDSINWDHVADDVVAMARDGGDLYAKFFSEIPSAESWWCGKVRGHTTSHASYKRGTVDWKDSLVIRPGHESSKS